MHFVSRQRHRSAWGESKVLFTLCVLFIDSLCCVLGFGLPIPPIPGADAAVQLAAASPTGQIISSQAGLNNQPPLQPGINGQTALNTPQQYPQPALNNPQPGINSQPSPQPALNNPQPGVNGQPSLNSSTPYQPAKPTKI